MRRTRLLCSRSLSSPLRRKQDRRTPPPARFLTNLISINFCGLFPDVALTNGEQIQEGSCNGIPLGRIPPKNKTPAAMIQFPQNNAVTSNLQTGAFTNAQLTYYAAPVSLNNDNVVIGHSHITCQLLPSLNSVDLLDINVFAFFKGLNDPADANGELTATAAAKDANGKITGLKPGPYRCCTINSGSNHLPIVPAFAQRGNVDDCVRFTVSDDPAASGNDGNANNANNATAGGADNGDNGNTADAGNAGTANTGNAKGQWRDKGRKQNQGQKRSNNVQPKEDGRRLFSPRGRSRIMRDIILH
ncbi:hypothetical protein BKA62DRAFT_723877 [Auriculariales sp. MPI-PUGE-AT-0066]|nr:hypothetical protein BKA62DRAFT_723877 [Auriculariales sp. MPI-PUGE-AT-0066]